MNRFARDFSYEEPEPEPERAPQPAHVPDPKQELRRAAAELDAARARVERDAARELADSRAKLIVELLPVLDNLDRAIAGSDDQGVRLVRTQLEGVLRGYGLERFEAVGERFDPRCHDAIAVTDVADPARDGVVVEQWQPGYRLGDRLMRPARVQVGRWRPSFA